MPALSAFRSDDARAAYLQLYDAVLACSAVSVTESDVETSYGRTHVLEAGDPPFPRGSSGWHSCARSGSREV